MVTLPISKIFVLSSALFASTSYALKLNSVWATGSWSAIGPPGGSGSSGHTDGFSLVNEASEAVSSDSYPGSYTACGGGYGHTFSLTGGCLLGEPSTILIAGANRQCLTSALSETRMEVTSPLQMASLAPISSVLRSA